MTGTRYVSFFPGTPHVSFLLRIRAVSCVLKKVLSGYSGVHHPLSPVIGLGLPNQRKKERIVQLLLLWSLC